MDRYCMDCTVELSLLSSKDVKRCKSCAARARWADPEYRIRSVNSFKVAHNKPDVRKKHSVTMKKAWKDGHMDGISDIVKKQWASGRMDDMSDMARKQWASGRMDVLARSRFPSSLEMLVKDILEKIGLEYVYQFRPAGLSRVYDFLIIDRRILIEVDGWYWHESEDAIVRGVPIKDAEKDKWALSHGYNMLRICENDVKDPCYLSQLYEILSTVI